jgi:hypothetical protein
MLQFPYKKFADENFDRKISISIGTSTSVWRCRVSDNQGENTGEYCLDALIFLYITPSTRKGGITDRFRVKAGRSFFYAKKINYKKRNEKWQLTWLLTRKEVYYGQENLARLLTMRTQRGSFFIWRLNDLQSLQQTTPNIRPASRTTSQ